MSVKPETAPYRAAFAPTDALAEKRREAFARFEELGFPTRRDEAWRFTNLRPLQQGVYAPSHQAETSADIESAIRPYLFSQPTYRLVFVNGRFAPKHSRLDGLPPVSRLESTASALAKEPTTLGQSLIDETDTAGGQA